MKTLLGYPWLLHRPLRPLMVGILVALLAGCSYPKPTRTYEFLINYDRMTDRFDPLLSLVYMPEGAKFADYEALIIGRMDVGRSVKDPEKADQYATYFRWALQKRLARSQTFDFITLDPDFSPSEDSQVRMLRLESKITRLSAGSGWKRYFGWFLFLQAGASDFQIEGRFTDASSREPVMEFCDRRRHLYNTPWGPNPGTFKNERVMKITLGETAACLTEFIQQADRGLPDKLVDRKASKGAQ